LNSNEDVVGREVQGDRVYVKVLADAEFVGCGDQDAMEYAECEAVVKEYPPFVEAMKKRGIEDMDLVMVDPW